MSSYLIQLLIWAGLAYLLGCYLGCWFRKMGADDTPPPVTKTVTPPPAAKKPEMPAVAKAAIPAAAAVATAAVVKEVMSPREVVVPKAPPPPPPPPPPRPVVKVEPVKVEPVRVAKVEAPKVITREMHTKADPLPTVRAATTTLPNHLTRKAEEIHHDKTIRHVEGGADRVLETRVGTTRTAEAKPIVAPKPVVTETRRVVAEPVRATPVAAPAAVTKTVEVGGMSRPKGIADARGGRPDDLQRISGVGPKNEKILHKLGFYHFDQIAGWSQSEAAWVDDHLKFGGRVKRENWIHQASLLAAGKETEFLKQYGTGGLKNSAGDKVSGSKTRK
jgi:predicted flap endonuclease-1-like 5' DNA nuclease